MTAKRVSNELRHDALVAIVEEEMLYRGYSPVNMDKFVPYYVGGLHGELDFYAINQSTNSILLFEMKCSNTYKTRQKAREQLERAASTYMKKYAPERRVFGLMAYYSPESTDGWDCMWIKNLGGKKDD